jgi:hypothetical protein
VERIMEKEEAEKKEELINYHQKWERKSIWKRNC